MDEMRSLFENYYGFYPDYSDDMVLELIRDIDPSYNPPGSVDDSGDSEHDGEDGFGGF